MVIVSSTVLATGCNTTSPGEAEAEMREIAASTDQPIYYRGAEYLGDVADPIIWNAMGDEMVGDRSLDAGQSLSIGYGDSCGFIGGDTCGAMFENSTDPFRGDHLPGDCRILPALRGVPAADLGDGVLLVTDDWAIKVSASDGAEQAARAAAALREVGQDEPSDLPPPLEYNVSTLESVCE